MKCAICGQNCGRFVVCFDHKDTKYKGTCPIHGSTYFIGRQCLKCQELKEPIYVVKNKKDRFGKQINRTHYLYPYLNRLTNLSRACQEKYEKRISPCAGVYGIFAGNVCLYVGQSKNISVRIKQHKENFKIAQKHIQGLRIHKKRISIKKIDHKVEYKYYEMAKSYKLSDLTYKTLVVVQDSEEKFDDIVTYAEQAMMIAYKPKFNHIAARPNKQRK